MFYETRDGVKSSMIEVMTKESILNVDANWGKRKE